MKAATLLKIAGDVIDVLDQEIIDDLDEFVAPTPQQDAVIAARIEAILKAHGVDVPTNVDKIVQSIPLILMLFAS